MEHCQRVRTQVDSVDNNLPPLAGVEPGSLRSTMPQTTSLPTLSNLDSLPSPLLQILKHTHMQTKPNINISVGPRADALKNSSRLYTTLCKNMQWRMAQELRESVCL